MTYRLYAKVGGAFEPWTCVLATADKDYLDTMHADFIAAGVPCRVEMTKTRRE